VASRKNTYRAKELIKSIEVAKWPTLKNAIDIIANKIQQYCDEDVGLRTIEVTDKICDNLNESLLEVWYQDLDYDTYRAQIRKIIRNWIDSDNL
jgi:hypothetical protein